MDFFESLTALENTPELHCARLLILLDAFAGEDGQEEIDGLTKLAKLDFFLRYPVLLERALEARKRSAKAAEVKPHERDSVESKMVRYKFGPWDHRYRRFLAILQAKGLVKVRMKGLGRAISLTEKGRASAEQLAHAPDFAVVAKRAKVLKDSLDLGATRIKEFVYETFPEIASLKLNDEIES